MKTNRKFYLSTIAVAAALSFNGPVRAEQADKFTRPHSPFTAYGMQVRMSVADPIHRGAAEKLQPTVFQEIAPCRLASTFAYEHYENPWGGDAYAPHEIRHYPSRGVLQTATFVDPCSEEVPATAIGIVGRFTVAAGNGDGEVHIDPSDPMSPNATTVLKFRKNEVLMFEAGVMFGPGGTFGVATWNAGADVSVDVLGYLLPDPAPGGGRGDKGEQGIQGEKGEKGDTGDAGAVGPAGPAGPAGANGEKGEIGPAGAKGDQGERGEKGATGEVGPAGPKGNQGERGANGAAGPKGDKGETGAQGPIGPAGATGPAGPKGDKGATGEKGAAGPKGDKGNDGAQGAQGPAGPMGPMGPKGDKGDPGSGFTATKGNACYPPGNNANSAVTVSDWSVKSNSIIMLNYTDAGSNGNALALVSQGIGSFQTTGSPNRCFQYVVLTPH